MVQDTKQLVVKQIPFDLWRQLKIRAIEDNSTIQATVAKAIEHYLKTA